MSDQNYRWTAKGPLLLLGIAFVLVGGFLATHRGRWALVGLVVIGLGVIAVIEASTVGNWCAPAEQKFGTLQWGQPFQESPSLLECWKMVRR